MMLASPVHLVSVDPGSSDKGWSVWVANAAMATRADHRTIAIGDLGVLIDEVCAEAANLPVLLSFDAPIRAFDGIQAPRSLNPASVAVRGRSWPFNVNPFAQRACEKALSSRPQVKNSSLQAAALATAIGDLLGWRGECKSNSNVNFTDLHPGVSVLGYMGAPHAPVMRTFLGHLSERARARSIEVVYDQHGPFRPNTITILETHPAVALGFYASMGVQPFPRSVPVYKGGKEDPADFSMLGAALCSHLLAKYGCAVGQPVTDDELDSLVGLLNLLDLAHGNGDFFGSDDGYFLIPSPATGPRFSTLWKEATTACCSRP